MLPVDPRTDPVVEILRLAYRRGLAIQREQEERGTIVSQQAPKGEIRGIELEDSNTGIGANEVRAKVSN